MHVMFFAGSILQPDNMVLLPVVLSTTEKQSFKPIVIVIAFKLNMFLSISLTLFNFFCVYVY